MDIAFTKGIVVEEEILCPCASCCNDSWEKREVVLDHLISKGFVQGYKEWFYHGEDNRLMDCDDDVDSNISSDETLRDCKGIQREVVIGLWLKKTNMG